MSVDFICQIGIHGKTIENCYMAHKNQGGGVFWILVMNINYFKDYSLN